MGELAPITPIAPAPLPVSFKVQGISGRPGQYLATIVYAGESHVVREGTVVPDEGSPDFDVKQITPDAVTIFDRRINRLVKRLALTE